MKRILRRLTYTSRPYKKNKEVKLPNGTVLVKGGDINMMDMFDVGVMLMLRLNDDEYDNFLEKLEDAGLSNDLPLDNLSYSDKRKIIEFLDKYGPEK